MKLEIFTIVLDGMPYLPAHLPVFSSLNCDWHWTIAEGAAMNVKDTAWCRPQPPRLSRDGTAEYLNAIRNHPRVTVIQRQSWNGKVEQCNACLEHIAEPCVLLQMDVDEIWSAKQLHALLHFFHGNPHFQSAEFFCRYFVGPNIIITSNNTYATRPGDWHRAWRFEPWVKFLKHEPPVLNRSTDPRATREQTWDYGLVFEHWAYAMESQVAFKEKYYGYRDAVKHWKRLQYNQTWPVRLGDFFPWVKDNTTADLLHKS